MNEWWKRFRGTRDYASLNLTAVELGDPASARHDLISGSPELSDIYRSLGYDAELTARTRKGVGELKSLIEARILDLPAFWAATQQATQRMAAEGLASDPLLEAVAAAGDDEGRVLALMNRRPVDDQLPFVERLPIRRGGKLAWRSPLDHTVLSKRPGDTRAFRSCLDKLESVLSAPSLPAKELPRERALDAVKSVRRGLDRQTAYLPTALLVLEEAVQSYCRVPSGPDTGRKDALDGLVFDLLRLARFLELTRECEAPLEPPAAAEARKVAEDCAGRVVETSWMHQAWLVRSSLEVLLGTCRLDIQHGAKPAQRRAAQVLEAVRREVVSGRYDGHENIRRLRQLEGEGTYVNSLAFALLRIRASWLEGREKPSKISWKTGGRSVE